LERREKRVEFAVEQAARAEILLAEEAGYLEGDQDQQFTAQFKQADIRRAVDEESAAKSFDLRLPEFGPYKVSYTRYWGVKICKKAKIEFKHVFMSYPSPIHGTDTSFIPFISCWTVPQYL
jgi:hypothetical protein